MSPLEAIFVSIPPKTGKNVLQPPPPPPIVERVIQVEMSWAIKKVLSYLAEKAQYVVATKKVHCHERMENHYEEIYVIQVVGASDTKQVFSLY